MSSIAHNMPVVSVIVPTHNAGPRLEDLLTALTAQMLADPYEVIVVDDASTDSTADRVARWPTVRYLRRDRQNGSYAARNDGLRAARGSVLAFTDADCAPGPGWLEEGLRTIQGNDMVAGHIEFELAERPTIAAIVDSIRFLDQENYAQQGYGATANLFVRRDVFDRVGAFNPRLRSGGDQEFGLRATARGAKIRYAPQAVVRHESRDTLRAVARKSFRIGRGVASQRLHAQGPLRALAPRPTLLRLYTPRRTVPGWHRMVGRTPVHRKLLVRVVDYLAAQLPFAVGIVFGATMDE